MDATQLSFKPIPSTIVLRIKVGLQNNCRTEDRIRVCRTVGMNCGYELWVTVMAMDMVMVVVIVVVVIVVVI